MEFTEKWEKVDREFFIKFINIHNEILSGNKDEKDFDEFVLKNKEKLNNPDYLQIFAERMNSTVDYFHTHFEMCQFFYSFMEDNPEWKQLPFGLRTYLRLGMFEDLFKEYLHAQK
ncbi:hypothetical protein [Bacillus cereus group sp. BfR-BA-01328]|uniref:hypothetical protein n=1 Tax=Bacillus cereus group sp. BfR-BA-01328 TaxID=2920304 RepID=UPI001F5A7CEA